MARGAIAYKGQLYLGGSKVEANPTGSATGGNLSKLGVDDTVYAIPQANNGTLTIQKNGTNVATFSANQSENVTANIDVSEDIAGTQTATGNPLTLTNVAPINAESLVVELEPKQEGSGDPSPTNIRPITGYTQTSVEGVGKNLCEKSTVTSQSGVTITIADDGTMTLDGTASAYIYIRGAFHCEDQSAIHTYALFNNVASSGVEFSVRQADTSLAGGWNVVNAVNKSYPFSIDNGKVATMWQFQINPNTVLTNAVFKVMIAVGDVTISEYEPYQSTSATIQFGQTVYGAEVDFGGGTDDKIAEVDFSTALLTKNDPENANDYLYYIQGLSVNKNGYLSCSQAPKKTSPPMGNTLGVAYSGSGNIYINLTSAAISTNTVEGMRAYCVNNDVQLFYEKSTASHINTDASPLKLLKGTNNLSADGVMQIGYQPDNSIGDAVKASEEYTDRRMDALGDLAYINEDGDNSTKFLRGDGTWQNTPAGVTTLAALTDTTISSPSNGQVLKYDGSKWVNSADYSLPTASAGTLGGVKVGANLSIDANGVLSATGGGANALNDLTDVSAASPSNKQVLAYDSSQSKWVAVDADVVAIPRSYWSSTTRELDFMITVPAYNTQRILKFSLMHAAGLAASEYMFALDRGDVYSSKMAGDTCGISSSYSSSTYTYTITITMPSVSGSPNFIFAMTMYNGSDKTW